MAAKDDRNAAIASGNLIQLLVTIGELSGEAGAAAAGEAAVAFANSSRDDAQRVFERAAHSDALRQLGVLAHAEVLLREAEAIQKQGQPPLPRLYSLQGFQYCNLLFVRGYGAEVSARVSQVQDSWSKMPWWRSTLLDDALYELANARAMLAAVSLAATPSQNYVAASFEALAALRRANDETHLPRGLLSHAEARWRCGDADATAGYLREAEDIAARGPMPLFMTQAHLLRARIALSRSDFAVAREKRAAAAALIEKHDYGRGAVELAVLDAELAIAASAPDADNTIAAALKTVAGEPYYDERTKRTISGGWFGLLPRLEAILPPDHAGLAGLQAARDACNAERDAYLRSTLARDVEGYDPANDPIAAYLGVTAPAPQPDTTTETEKVSRNAPCPCGSGKKFKHCHGALV